MLQEQVKTPNIEGSNETSSYRSIFKATSLFGGVQVYQILVGVIKSKFIALLLGPMGMGIQGLYQSTIDLVKSVSAFGLESSAVRDISEAHNSGDHQRLVNVVSIVKRLIWITGLLGLVLALVFSPLLSKVTFGNGDYTWGFIILSSTLLINQICVGQRVILQGMRRLKDLAKASAIGATVGLIVSVPLYYWIGVKGIVPTMVLTSLTAMLLTWYYSNKLKIEKKPVTTKEAIEGGKSMLKMGVAMSISGILVTVCAYIIRWFIRKEGGVEEVGLYTAGFAIVNNYVGMVFTAMGTDYYPRLAAVNKDNNRCKDIINQQGEIALLVLGPIIISCIIAMPFFIRLIYADSFLAANNYIMFAVAGVLFKAVSWVISYYFLAKAESRLFVINETITNIYFLIIYLLGYYCGGLTGLGISFALGYIIYMIQVYIIARKRYDFSFSSSFTTVLFVQLLLVVLCLIVRLVCHSILFYVLGSILLLVCFAYSIITLNRRMQLLKAITSRLNNGR